MYQLYAARTCYGRPIGIFLILIAVLTSLTKKKHIQPTNILLGHVEHSRTIVAETKSPVAITYIRKI